MRSPGPGNTPGSGQVRRCPPPSPRACPPTRGGVQGSRVQAQVDRVNSAPEPAGQAPRPLLLLPATASLFPPLKMINPPGSYRRIGVVGAQHPQSDGEHVPELAPTRRDPPAPPSPGRCSAQVVSVSGWSGPWAFSRGRRPYRSSGRAPPGPRTPRPGTPAWPAGIRKTGQATPTKDQPCA